MNMIQKAKEQVQELTKQAYAAAVQEGLLPEGVTLEPSVEIPKDVSNGDYTTTFCLAAAKAMKMNPRQVATILTGRMALEGSYFTSVEIAGPGFMNFRLGDRWFGDTVAAIEAAGEDYGCGDMLKGQRIMVEFVSANPTGPMHMGNARGGVLGDCLAEVLHRAGNEVTREFYVNDAGNQIDKFSMSLDARYQQLILGEDQVAFPEDGYHGNDIRELAKQFYQEHGDSYLHMDDGQRRQALAKFGLERNIPAMKADLERYLIHYDVWFFESTLHESGFVADTVQKLTDGGWTYEKEGALWLKTSALLYHMYRAEGKSDEDIEKLELKDDVLRRANGFYTYFAADIAYHRNKLEVRGFDRVINIWGADHHGHVARLKCALDALGLDGSHRLEIVLMQLVQLVRDGQPVRMSKRTGNAIALHDLLDEVNVDAARFFFNARSAASPIEFDLGLAVRQDSENPVYYVQYAHARIQSILKALAQDGLNTEISQADLTLLREPSELELIRELSHLPEEIRLAAVQRDPSRLNRYATQVAAAFHKFYTECRIRDTEPALRDARILLCRCTAAVIRNTLSTFGVSAPDHM